MKSKILLMLILTQHTPMPKPQHSYSSINVAVYRACLAEYRALPWWKRMWYRHDGNCQRYLKDPYQR